MLVRGPSCGRQRQAHKCHSLNIFRQLPLPVYCSDFISKSLLHTVAVIFVGVFETDDCRKNRKESWLLKVMVAYTVWILLFVIWVFIFSTYGKAILGRSKIGEWLVLWEYNMKYVESYEEQNNIGHYFLLQGVRKIMREGGDKEKRWEPVHIMTI